MFKPLTTHHSPLTTHQLTKSLRKLSLVGCLFIFIGVLPALNHLSAQTCTFVKDRHVVNCTTGIATFQIANFTGNLNSMTTHSINGFSATFTANLNGVTSPVLRSAIVNDNVFTNTSAATMHQIKLTDCPEAV